MSLQAQMVRFRDAATELLLLLGMALQLDRLLDWLELAGWRRDQRRNPS